MKEILNNGVETGAVEQEYKAEIPVNKEELSKEILEANEKFKVASAQDRATSAEDYQKVLQETKGTEKSEQNLTEVNAQLDGLKKELDDRKNDFKNLFISYSYDAPTSGVSYQKGGGVKALAEKYQGMDKIVAAIQKAREAAQPTKTDEKADNIWGKLFGAKKVRPAEITAVRAQAIENALTSGTPGLNASPESWKNVIGFLSKNSPELLKTEKYQDIIIQLGQSDAEFMEANKSLLVKPEEITDEPTSVRDSINLWKEGKNKEITELENKKSAIEGSDKIAA
jgi:hypothetical protein